MNDKYFRIASLWGLLMFHRLGEPCNFAFLTVSVEENYPFSAEIDNSDEKESRQGLFLEILVF